MLAPARSRRPELAAVLGTLLVGAFLRLYQLDYAQFRPDDEALWSLARTLIEHPRVLTRGIPSSFGLSNGPFQVYLLAPGAALTAGPLGAYVVVALLNLAGLFAFWWFVRSHWGAAVALAALVLAATNPWAVVFSRRLLGNDLVAPFTVLLIASLAAWIARGRGRDLVLAFVWLAVAIQLYVVALLHVVLMALGLWLGHDRLRRRWVALGTALFGLAIFPYAARSAIRELYALGRLYGEPGQGAVVDLEAPRLMLGLVSSEGYQAFASQIGAAADATRGWGLVVTAVATVAMLFGMADAGFRASAELRLGDQARAAPSLLALCAVLLPALLLIRHVTTVHPTYMVTGLPFQYLFVAIGLVRAAELLERALRAPAVGRVALAGSVGALAVAYLSLAQLFFAGIRGYWTLNDYGLPMRYTLDLESYIVRTAREAQVSRVLVAGGEEHAGVLYRLLRRDLPDATTFDPNDMFVVPSGTAPTALYVFSSAGSRLASAVAAAPLSRQGGTFDVPGEGLSYRLVVAAPARVAELFEREITTKTELELDGRVTLDGFSASSVIAPGGTDRVTLGWRISDKAIGQGPELKGFFRVFDLDKRHRGGRDFPFLASAQWRPGDRIVSWVPTTVPADLTPGVYSYRVGLYSVRPTGDYDNLPVRDPTGHTVGDSAPLGWHVVRGPAPAQPAVRVDGKLADAVRLVGYDLTDSGCEAPAGRRLTLNFQWTAERPLDRDYTVFVHLVDADGKIVAQHDAPPAEGRFPTSAWPAGDRIVDAHRLALPAATPTGLRALAGLYDPSSGQRLGGLDAAVALPLTLNACPRA